MALAAAVAPAAMLVVDKSVRPMAVGQTTKSFSTSWVSARYAPCEGIGVAGSFRVYAAGDATVAADKTRKVTSLAVYASSAAFTQATGSVAARAIVKRNGSTVSQIVLTRPTPPAIEPAPKADEARRVYLPSGMTLTMATGDRLYVVDSQLNGVVVFDLQGKFVKQFGERGAGPGEFNFPTHVTADSQGFLWVTDSLNGRIQKFDRQGNYQGRIGSPGDSSGHFSRPKGAALDSLGRVYVVDGLFGNVQIFDPDGRLLLALGQAGSQAGEFWLPNGIAISRDNRIFVADSYNRRVQILKYVGGAQ